jgi:hypothetical protein
VELPRFDLPKSQELPPGPSLRATDRSPCMVTESAFRPPCGFWRIDDQQLDIQAYVESFVVYNIQKGNTDVEINLYMCINDEKEKVMKIS